jgi:hypothetical protein
MAEQKLPPLPTGSVDFNKMHDALLAAEKKKVEPDMAAIIDAATHKEPAPVAEAPASPAAEDKEA